MASTLAQTTLSGVATGAGTTIDFTDARAKVTAVMLPSGTITDGLVALEASQDGLNWVVVHFFDPLGGNQFFSQREGAFRYWRGNVTRPVAGGGAVRVTLMEADR
jgi:hypothetical protein